MIYFRTLPDKTRLVITVNSVDYDAADITPPEPGQSLVLVNVVNQAVGQKVILTLISPVSIRQDTYTPDKHLYSIQVIEQEIAEYLKNRPL